MNFQKDLTLKTGEEMSIHFDIFTGTDGYLDVIKDVTIGRIFNLYFLADEGSTIPLRIKIQKQVAFNLNGKKIYKNFGEIPDAWITTSDEIFAVNVETYPIFDRLVILCADGIGGDVVHVLLKIL